MWKVFSYYIDTALKCPQLKSRNKNVYERALLQLILTKLTLLFIIDYSSYQTLPTVNYLD